MKVAELMEILAELSDDAEVVLSRDGEGNGYRPLDSYSTGFAVLNRRPGSNLVADVDLVDDEETCPVDCDGRFHQPDPCDAAPSGAVFAVVLWPSY